MPSPDDQITITISRADLEGLKTVSQLINTLLEQVSGGSDDAAAQAEAATGMKPDAAMVGKMMSDAAGAPQPSQ